MSLSSFIKNLFTKTDQSNVVLRQTFDHMLEGIQIHDFNWRYLYVNSALVKYSHYSKEELLGSTLMEKYPGIENTDLFKVVERCMKKRVSEHFETEFVFPDGSKADFELSIQPVPEGLFILSINITERKRAQEKQKISEIHYHSIIEQANDTIYIIDSSPKPKLIDINQSGCRLLGYTKEELLQLTVFDINFECDLTDSASKIEELRAGIPVRTEQKFKRKDGSAVEIELSAKKMADGNIMVVARDISERKKAEQEIKTLNESLERKVKERTTELEHIITELKESEEKFQKAFDASAAGISITNLSDTNLMDINRAFTHMTGFTKEEAIGHNTKELGLITNIAKREEVLKEIQEHGYARNFEMTVRHRSGKEFEILASVETIILKGKKCALNIIHDITDRKTAERQLMIVNQELEAFTYSVSHDLRSPLRAINGYAEILQEDYQAQFNDEANRLLQNIKQNAIKMGNLIDDLLAFSKLGRQEIEKEEVDLNELLETIIIELNKNQPHKTTIKYTTLHKVKADYNLLYQVIFNLVSNGIKYSSKGENPEVEINSEEKNGEIILSVKDNGAGFDMKYADKLFGVFQRLHSQEEFEGTGVGLAIVHRVITKHKGRVWAEGKINEGATFHISLPINENI